LNISILNANPNRVVYKIVLLGDGGVGKTSIRRRYLGEGFSNDYLMTIGAEFAVKRFDDSADVLQIWDLAGQPRFDGVRQAYYAGTSAAILVYDITRPDTFYSISNWIAEILTHRNLDRPLPLILVANKNDLSYDENYSVVTTEQGIAYSKDLSDWAKLEVPFIETSAKTGFNVSKMFDELIDNMELVNLSSS
jgi:small GTP-binding protein